MKAHRRPFGGSSPNIVPRLGLSIGCLLTMPVGAQDATRSASITPTFSASETYTRSTLADAGGAGGEFVTRLSPGIGISSRSGRVQGSLRYTLNALQRSRQSDARDVENALSAAFTAEAVERRAFVDAQATITQQSLSAYGVQTLADSTQANTNRAEVGTASVSPYVRGALGAAVDYEVRLHAGANEVKGSSDNDSTDTGATVTLGATPTGARLAWGFSASQQATRYKLGRKTTSERTSLSLSYRPDADLSLSLNGGQESTDVGLVERRRYDNWGYGGRWTPTDRSSIRFQSDRRYFGRSHALSFEHRMQRSVWSYTDARDVTGGSDPNGVGQPLTLYQVYFAQFASAQPDPALREQMVLDFLRALGRDPGEILRGGMLNSGVSLQRRQDLSFAWTGLRTSFNLQAFASSTRLIDNPGGVADGGDTRLNGCAATLSYRLTPLSSLTFSGSRQATEANAARGGNLLKSVTAGWTAQAGRLITTSLSARHVVFDSAISPYHESSLTAALGMRF